MATSKPFNSKLVQKDYEDRFTADLNLFVRDTLLKLSQEEDPYSPIDTGFFASSWIAQRSRPRPQDAREEFAPWKNIKATRKGNKSPQAKVEPRFIDNINYNFKIFEKFYIGNTTKYAAYALASKKNKIDLLIKNDLKSDIKNIFSDKKPKIGLAQKAFKGGQGGIGQFADSKRKFVDYTNL